MRPGGDKSSPSSVPHRPPAANFRQLGTKGRPVSLNPEQHLHVGYPSLICQTNEKFSSDLQRGTLLAQGLGRKAGFSSRVEDGSADGM